MKVFRLIISGFLVFCIIFTMTFNWKSLSEKKIEQQKEYKGIISLWHIDSFEGGFGSRKQFLLDVSSSFEKQNDGVFIMVTNHTKTSASEKIKQGIYPDMLSYGTGINVEGFKNLSIVNNFIGGKVGEKNYANVWCRGGYVLVYNPQLVKDETQKNIDTLLVSKGESTLPLVAFTMSNFTTNNIEVLSPLESYIKFVGGKVPYFLCTQRDVVRLNNRGFNYRFVSLDGYNDLYQYISILTKENFKLEYCERFIELLLSENVQKKLSKISMCSVKQNDINFNIDGLNEIQNTKYLSTISAFSSKQLIEELHENSILASRGEESAKTKIKNVLILP